MELVICGGETLTLEDGTVGTFADKSGEIIAVLTVSRDCWSELPRDGKAGFNPDIDAHLEYETTTTDVPAASDTKQFRKIQAVRICRDKFGNVVKCPPR